MDVFIDVFIELATFCVYCGVVGLITKVILDEIEYWKYRKEEKE